MGFLTTSTAAVADACLREGVPLRHAGLIPSSPGRRMGGRVLAVRHAGSVDIFLEVLATARAGDVLVVDNEGRDDEACVGDLTAMECKARGVQAMVIDGRHRDHIELANMGFPVWSRGRVPPGPRAARPRRDDALGHADIAGHAVVTGDFVCLDDDGVMFVAATDVERVLATANAISATERDQSEAVTQGRTLYEQFRFDEFLAARKKDPKATLRDHLRRVGKEIEQ